MGAAGTWGVREGGRYGQRGIQSRLHGAAGAAPKTWLLLRTKQGAVEGSEYDMI